MAPKRENTDHPTLPRVTPHPHDQFPVNNSPYIPISLHITLARTTLKPSLSGFGARGDGPRATATHLDSPSPSSLDDVRTAR